jgi:hypothetical protein
MRFYRHISVLKIPRDRKMSRLYTPVPAPLPSCMRTTDNRTACPPRMADGRAFTDYRSRGASMPASLSATYGNEQARLWLMSNGESLIANARQSSLHKNSCNSCNAATMVNGDVVPEAATQICTAEACGVATLRVPGGMGLGRRYTTDRMDTAGAYIGRLPGHLDQTFRSRGVVGAAATCATDEDRDIAWSGFAATVPATNVSMTGRR